MTTNQPKASDLVAEARGLAAIVRGPDTTDYIHGCESLASMVGRLADELDLCQRRKENVHLRLELEAEALKQARAREAKLREALEWYAGKNSQGSIFEGYAGDVARRALSEETTKE